MSLLSSQKGRWDEYTRQFTPQHFAGLGNSSIDANDVKSVSLQEKPIFYIDGFVNEKKQQVIKAQTKGFIGMVISYYQVL